MTEARKTFVDIQSPDGSRWVLLITTTEEGRVTHTVGSPSNDAELQDPFFHAFEVVDPERGAEEALAAIAAYSSGDKSKRAAMREETARRIREDTNFVPRESE